MSTKQDVLRLLYGTINKPLSGQEIAEELNLSRRTIQRAVADLEKAGFIKTEQRFRRKGGKSSLLYTVLK